jgi:hypothetical protein
MEIYISTQETAVEDIMNVYSWKYKLDKNSITTLRIKLEEYMERIRKEVHILIETDYVDKTYRDLYYNYYSTKFNSYYRNCIRISFFNSPVTEEKFFSKEGTLQARREEDYLGFLVIRPTFPQIIGRNVLSPKALKPELSDFRTCSTCFSATANGVKFDVTGFPHASQDGEMQCCADITIWAMMEYLGNKYPEYSVVHPSKTMASLENITYERQLPTAGLSVESISYALKKQGLAPKIYIREEWGDYFERFFSCYIESGLPIVAAIDMYRNSESKEPDSHHAVICIGHVEENIEDCLRQASEEFKTMDEDKPVKVYDWDKAQKQFVFIDDNLPPYQKASLNNPLDYCNTSEIAHFVVPLYSKIYLDVNMAKQHILRYITNRNLYYLNPQWDDRIILRTFLTSSRSYKQYIMHNEEIDPFLQGIILKMNFPKFIWVGELSTPEWVAEKKINGLIILDATEPRDSGNDALLLITNSTRIAYKSEEPTINKFREEVFKICNNQDFSEENTENEENILPLQPFRRYDSNIK